MTIDSVPELARRVRHLETLVKRGKPADGSDNASLLKRISALESSVARIGKAAPTKPQVYTPKPAATVPKPANNSLAIKVSDHGALTGLADDDHSQYLNNTRHDTTTRHSLGTVVAHDDHGALSGLSDNDHPQYLLTTGKAADSDKLDGIDSTGFAAASHDHDAAYLGKTAKAADSDKLDGVDSTGFVNTTANQTVGGIKTFSSIPVLPASDPTTANQAVRKGFADATYLGIGAGVWANWTPTQTGWTALPTGQYRYAVIGKVVHLNIYMSAETSNATTATLTLPIAASTATNSWGVCGWSMNNGVTLTSPSIWNINGGGTTVAFGIAYGAMGGWTASGTKRIIASITYAID